MIDNITNIIYIREGERFVAPLEVFQAINKLANKKGLKSYVMGKLDNETISFRIIEDDGQVHFGRPKAVKV